LFAPHPIGHSKLTRLSALQITSSPAQSSDPHWVYLRSTSNHSIALSFPLEWGRSVRITGLLGAGSTGSVYRGSMGEKTLAVKIVEILSPEDDSKRQRLRSEFGIYSLLELAFSSGKLTQRIAPQFYGAFESQRLDALIMELHDSRLSTWDDLGSWERLVETATSLRMAPYSHTLPASKFLRW
jgi:hypothetical protein